MLASPAMLIQQEVTVQPPEEFLDVLRRLVPEEDEGAAEEQ